MSEGLLYLLDTNVISEFARRPPHAKVIQFFAQVDPLSLAVSALTLGELRKRAAMRPIVDPVAAQGITSWVDTVESSYEERVLLVDVAIANIWAALSAQRSRPIIDTLLAATALHHGLTMVTRNTADVRDTGVPLINPSELP
jgi:predicted nucleic acid-binding protein